MKRRGRPILGAFSGFFFGLFLGLSLLFNGVIPLESNLLVILPLAGLVLVWAVAMWFPIPRRRSSAAPAGAAPDMEPSADATPTPEENSGEESG